MTVYAELVAKLPTKIKLLNKFPIPKRLSLAELNEMLRDLEQLSMKTNKSIPLKLKIMEETLGGSTILFSNEWNMKAGNPTNILALVNFALAQYYPDTPEEQKNELTEKIEQALETPLTTTTFQVEKQKSEFKTTELQGKKQEKNILDLTNATKLAIKDEPKRNTENPPDTKSIVKQIFHWKVLGPLLLSYVGLAILCVVFSVGSAMYFVTNSGISENVANTTTVQSLPNTTAESVVLPFTVHEEGKKEKAPITLSSYMKVDKLAAIKGIAAANKTLVFKNNKGKEIGKTKTNNKGVFEIELIEGE